MTAKPPVPSKPPFPGVEAIREALRELIPEGLDVDNCEAGYIVGYSRGFIATQTVARLEAEVAELWELVEDMRGRAESKLHQAADALQDQVLGRLPRRTPELTERAAMWLKEHGQDWPIALCRADAAALLDLVFGKGHG